MVREYPGTRPWSPGVELLGGRASPPPIAGSRYEQDGAHSFFSIPEIVFEFSITVYTIVKGFAVTAKQGCGRSP
jgi:hypothetical protein